MYSDPSGGLLSLAILGLCIYLVISNNQLRKEVRWLREELLRRLPAQQLPQQQAAPQQAPAPMPAAPQQLPQQAAPQQLPQPMPAPMQRAPLPQAPSMPVAPTAPPLLQGRVPAAAAPAPATVPAPAAAPAPRPVPAAVPQPTASAPLERAPLPGQRSPLPEQRPAFPTAAPAAPAARAARTSMENILGRNVLGILAALLIFSGLVFLALAVLPALTDEVRCIAMFVFSGALFAGGVATCEKETTPFSQALLGTGAGAVFISLFVANAYFGLLPGILTLLLLLAWLALCLALTKRYASIPMAIIAQLGMVISVCFAYASGIAQGQLVIVVAYQLLSSLLVCLAFEVWIEDRARWGLLSSLVVTLIATQFISSASGAAQEGQPTLVLLLLQFAGATALAILTARSIEREAEPLAHRPAFIAAAVIWSFVSFFAIDIQISRELEDASLLSNKEAGWISTLALSFIHALAAAACVRASRKGSLPAKFAFDACVIAAAVATFWQFAISVMTDHLSLLVLVGAGLWFAGRYLPSAKMQRLSLVWLAVDAVLMLVKGYRSLNNRFGWWLSLIYLAALLVLVFFWWRSLEDERRQRTGGLVLLVSLIVFEVSLFSVFAGLDRSLMYPFGFLAALAVLCVVALTRTDTAMTGGSGAFALGLSINELAVQLLSCVMVAAWGEGILGERALPATAANIGVLGLDVALLALRWPAIEDQKKPFAQVSAGLVATALVFGIAHGFVPSVPGIIVTVACMVVALACTMLGFTRRLRYLRLFGLVLAIFCVVKLALVDVIVDSSIARVIALIVSGLICFGISALYNYAVKRYGEEEVSA